MVGPPGARWHAATDPRRPRATRSRPVMGSVRARRRPCCCSLLLRHSAPFRRDGSRSTKGAARGAGEGSATLPGRPKGTRARSRRVAQSRTGPAAASNWPDGSRPSRHVLRRRGTARSAGGHGRSRDRLCRGRRVAARPFCRSATRHGRRSVPGEPVPFPQPSDRVAA